MKPVNRAQERIKTLFNEPYKIQLPSTRIGYRKKQILHEKLYLALCIKILLNTEMAPVQNYECDGMAVWDGTLLSLGSKHIISEFKDH